MIDQATSDSMQALHRSCSELNRQTDQLAEDLGQLETRIDYDLGVLEDRLCIIESQQRGLQEQLKVACQLIASLGKRVRERGTP